MRYGSVCSGIEAATVAWHPLGWEPIFFSEVDKFPSAVLEHHYPETPNMGDMTKFEEWNFGRESIDVLVGGTPCQSFSVAGLRGGLGDDRGNLALTYIRMVDYYRPRWCVWENVPGVLSSNRGRDFGSIIGALAELGYGFAWRVLDAQYFGVPQRRRRVFLVGCSTGRGRDSASVLFESESCERDIEARRAKGKGSARDAKASTSRMLGFGHYADDGTASTVKARDYKDATDLVTYCADVAPTMTSSGPPYSRTGNARVESEAVVAIQAQAIGESKKGNGSGVSELETMYTLTAADRHAVCHQSTVRRLTPVECERLQGFPDNYTNITYGKKGAPDSGRYMALGNSMAVPVMRWIGQRIEEVDRDLR